MNKRISFKKFLLLFIYTMIIFIGYHLVIWQLYTSKIFNHVDKYTVGDLGRMSYQIDFLQKRKSPLKRKKEWISWELQL